MEAPLPRGEPTPVLFAGAGPTADGRTAHAWFRRINCFVERTNTSILAHAPNGSLVRLLYNDSQLTFTEVAISPRLVHVAPPEFNISCHILFCGAAEVRAN